MLIQHKTWAVFVLCSVAKKYKQVQNKVMASKLISICHNELEDKDEHEYKQWLVIASPPVGTITRSPKVLPLVTMISTNWKPC